MKKVTTSQRLKEIMNERNLKQVDIIELAKPFCDKYGIKLNKNDLSQYVSGKVEPGQYKLSILGLALNLNEAWLMGYDVPKTPSVNLDKEQKIRDENIHIKKYRTLDEYGKRAVDSVLDIEYERCINTDEQEKQPTITISYSRLPALAGAGYFLQEENLEEREFPDTPISRQADVVIPVDGDSMEPMFYDGDELYVRLQPAVNVGEIGIFLKGENAFVKEYAEDRLISLNPSFDDIYPSESEDEQIVCKGKVLGKV